MSRSNSWRQTRDEETSGVAGARGRFDLLAWPEAEGDGPGAIERRSASGAGTDGSRGRGRLLLAGGLALLLLAIAFSGTFRTLWSSWRNNDNYSHGILIPPISLGLVWRMRRQLAATEIRPASAGLLLLLGGVALQIVGIRGDVTIFQGYAFIFAAAGLIWTWFGARMLRRLWFPLAFLAFMVPVFPWFMNAVSFRLKGIAAGAAVRLAQWMGGAVTQEGMYLHFPSGMMTVENACSGLNSLIALMALGALFAHLSRGPRWKGTILFLVSIPVAIAANTVRLTSLCLAATLTDTETATGLFHDVGGFLLFGVALAMLALVRRGLRC